MCNGFSPFLLPVKLYLLRVHSIMIPRLNKSGTVDSEVTQSLISEQDDHRILNIQTINNDKQPSIKFPNNFKYVLRLFDKVSIFTMTRM